MGMGRRLALVALIVVGGCATIVKGTDQQVSLGHAGISDTIALQGSRERVRLVGFNAPETRNAACSAELQLGYRAKRRLRELVRLGPNDLRLLPFSCPGGAQGTERGKPGGRRGGVSGAGRGGGGPPGAQG